MKIFGICVFLSLVILFFYQIFIKLSPNQKKFSQGKVPTQPIIGLHQGSVGRPVPWQGKEFLEGQNGINVFKNGEIISKKYPFKTYIGKGILDKEIDVVKIDYSQNSSPWWLKYILDEIVEIAPNNYLGKVQITFIPFFPFTMGFFELKKE